jgi:O2-independent ubiquinone biosynthesis accessory factor UbiT
MAFPAFPKPLARLVTALPSYPPSLTFAAAGNLLVWPALRDQDWGGVTGSVLCVRVSDLGLSLYFSVRRDGFHAEPAGKAGVTFTARVEDLARLVLRLEDPDTLFFDRRLRIEGDTDLGLRAKNLLDAIEIDTAAASMPLGLGSLFLRLRAWAMSRSPA